MHDAVPDREDPAPEQVRGEPAEQQEDRVQQDEAQAHDRDPAGPQLVAEDVVEEEKETLALPTAVGLRPVFGFEPEAGGFEMPSL